MIEDTPADWKIEEFVSLTGRAGETRSLAAALAQSMEAETEHERKVKSRGKRTEYNRTSSVTEALAHNFMIMRALQLTADQAAPADSKKGSRTFGFFRDICVSLSAPQAACTETCDGKFRTFSGCCNNLVKPQYGEERTGWTECSCCNLQAAPTLPC